MSWLLNAVTDVKGFFSNLWNNVIKPDVQTAEQAAAAFFQAAITDAANELGIEGLQIVTDAVTAAESTGGSSMAKLVAAQTQVTSDLASAGKTVPLHIINAGIEAAVAQLNSSAAAQTATMATATQNQPNQTPQPQEPQTQDPATDTQVQAQAQTQAQTGQPFPKQE